MPKHRASRRVIVYAFLLVIATMLSITSLGLSRIRNLSTDLESLVQEQDVQIALMHAMRHAARDRSFILQSLMILKDPFLVDDYVLRMSEAASKYLASRNKLLKHKLSDTERDLLERQHMQSIETAASQNQIIDHMRNTEYAQATALLINMTLPGQRRAMGMMDEFIALKRQQNLASLNATAVYIEETYGLMILLGSFGMLFSMGVAGFVSRSINREIELRRNSENELRHSELRERIIRENIIDGVLTLDSYGRILSCNKACKKIFGYPDNELLDHSASILLPDAVLIGDENNPESHIERWENRMIGVGREVIGKRHDGSEFPAELDISKTTLEGEPIYIAVIRDITEKKETEKRLQQFNTELEQRVIERTLELANTNDQLRHEVSERTKAQHELIHLVNHDSLTGLPNRSMFNKHLEIMLNSAQRHNKILALFFMDLDGFKAINDTHGHEVGDRLLVEIAERLRNCVRKEDIVARMGGDEFTILLSELTQAEDVNVIAQKFINSVRQSVRIGDRICHVGVSIGISLFPTHAADSDSLLRLADDAMYAAKADGKNTYRLSTTDITTTTRSTHPPRA